ncbi:MAG: hypothetical protein JWO77_3800 [Ilumatobacteraceae bacterium]|nr:hypothetical protein [Ilumatobacteraceae bacterium]
MANRRCTLLFTGALVFGAALVPAGAVGARSAQDPGATFGGGGTETTTTLAVSTTAATTSEPDGNNQTLVESGETPDQPLWSENRKVAAIIGGLVFVALALLLLTIRYVRVTKPVPASAEEGLPMLPPTLELNDESVFVVASTDNSQPSQPVVATVPEVSVEPAIEPTTAEVTVIAAAAGTDPASPDDDYEPRTGEHERVEIATGATLVRPGPAARRKALGVDQA